MTALHTIKWSISTLVQTKATSVKPTQYSLRTKIDTTVNWNKGRKDVRVKLKHSLYTADLVISTQQVKLCRRKQLMCQQICHCLQCQLNTEPVTMSKWVCFWHPLISDSPEKKNCKQMFKFCVRNCSTQIKHSTLHKDSSLLCLSHCCWLSEDDLSLGHHELRPSVGPMLNQCLTELSRRPLNISVFATTTSSSQSFRWNLIYLQFY